jgi:hypothetical protein
MLMMTIVVVVAEGMTVMMTFMINNDNDNIQ